MANKIQIRGGEFDADNYGGDTDSDAEYTEKERKLLKKYRETGNHKIAKQKAVLEFEESDSDEDSNDDQIVADSDIEGKDEDEESGLPDSRAWGRKRSMYYNTDFVDPDYSGYTEKEQELAQQEEEEAKSIQQRLAAELADVDFSLDIFPQQEAKENENDLPKDEEHMTLQAALDSLTVREMQRLFQKESPEFDNLTKDFEKYFHENKTFLEPFINYTLSKNIEHDIVKFVKLRTNLIMNYCINIGFYVMLKAKRLSIKNHPLIKRLAQLKKLLNQIDEIFDSVARHEVEKAIVAIRTGDALEFIKEDIDIAHDKINKQKSQLKLLKTISQKIQPRQTTITTNDEHDEHDDIPMDTDDSEEEEQVDVDETGNPDDRRAITYEIAKNKGLTPHRKKELRNPRVKHRNKYRKALVRRKGAVRTVRKEIHRYDGEISGIKATVKKGIKLKS